jgi:hypothetical protein
MKRISCVAGSLALLLWGGSCVDYASLFPQESVRGIYGRLWVNPNPIRFPVVQPGSGETVAEVSLINVGSKRAEIEDIFLEGDPDFRFGWAESEFIDFMVAGEKSFSLNGHSECYRFQRVSGGIYYRPEGVDRPRAELVIQTSDPTSPTLRVPIYMHTEADQDERTTFALVRPNPIYFERAKRKERQVVDVCVRLEDEELSSRLTGLEAVGDGFVVEGVSDYDGNAIPLPVRSYATDEYHLQVKLAYEPDSNRVEDGSLAVRFTDGRGREQTLLVPVLVR